jgi:hypothetical protein
MNKSKIYTLLLALCLISCSDEIEITNEGSGGSIRFSAGVSNNTSLRVSTDSNFKTIFDEDDVIGIFIYSRNEEEEPSIDENELYVSNIQLTYKSGSWELERPIYYPDGKKLLDIYAYYPHKEGSDVHSMGYNAHEEMNELLMTSVIGTQKREDAIMLTFQHMQSLAHVTLTKDNNVPDFDENLNIYFNGVIGGKYNIATKELTEPLTGIIKMDLMGEANTKQRSYIAYIPEQEAAPGILFSIFQMTYNKEILSSKDIDQSETFTRGQVRVFNIRIKQEIDKNITYDVYDLYPKYGTPVGMVVEIYNGGKNGKIISLKNVSNVAWATEQAEAYATNATDINDGITNKMKIQALENWEENYPAFKACVDYGERWYLPCIGEMKWFFTDNTVGNDYRLSAINDRLWKHGEIYPELGIETIHLNTSYFSSTESSNEPTNALKLYTGGRFDTPAEPKSWSYYIRPFYEF